MCKQYSTGVTLGHPQATARSTTLATRPCGSPTSCHATRLAAGPFATYTWQRQRYDTPGLPGGTGAGTPAGATGATARRIIGSQQEGPGTLYADEISSFLSRDFVKEASATTDTQTMQPLEPCASRTKVLVLRS